MFGRMKTEKIQFKEIDRFKELVELTGLLSYTIDSDDGRGLIFDLECVKEHKLHSELKDFLYSFHTDTFFAAEGSAEIQIKKNEIQIIWSESSDLRLKDIQYDFNELLCSLFSLPSESPIDILFQLNFEISGIFKRDIELANFVFVLNVNPSDISEYGFSASKLKKVNAGLLFRNTNQIRKKFEMHLKKLLKKYRASNCTFSLAGDECSLSYFCTTELQKRKVIIQQPKR
jgi:hypothetical protein